MTWRLRGNLERFVEVRRCAGSEYDCWLINQHGKRSTAVGETPIPSHTYASKDRVKA